MHLGLDPNVYPDYRKYVERFAANLEPVIAKLNRGGCRVALENTYDPGPGPLMALMEILAPQHQVGVCLDVGHVTGFSSTPLPAWWQALAPHIIELHLHDNDGSGDQHLPVGWGRVDWEYLHNELGSLPRRPVLTLEPHTEPHLWGSLRGLQRVWGQLWTW